METDKNKPGGEVILYQTEDLQTRLRSEVGGGDGLADAEAYWRNSFQKDVRTINEHIHNLFEEGELQRRQLSGNSG